VTRPTPQRRHLPVDQWRQVLPERPGNGPGTFTPHDPEPEFLVDGPPHPLPCVPDPVTEPVAVGIDPRARVVQRPGDGQPPLRCHPTYPQQLGKVVVAGVDRGQEPIGQLAPQPVGLGDEHLIPRRQRLV
jgi:hypothetical protein